MIKNHLVMAVNAVILIALGVYGYIISGSPTALIAPAAGVILLVMAFPVKKNNALVSHIAVVLTLILSIVFFIVGIRRDNYIVIAMAVITFICFDLYVLNFILRKKQREENRQSV